MILGPKYRNWVSMNVDATNIKEVPNPHITILYGFYPEIQQKVDEAKITPQDYQLGDIRLGDHDPVYLVAVKSDKLQKLFWELHDAYPNQHTLIDGKYSPHVTLCWLKEWPKKK